MDGVKFFSLCLPYGSKIMSLLGVSILKPKETQFFYDVIKETLKIRREEEGKNAAKRNDLVGKFMFLFIRDRSNMLKNMN